MTKRLPLCQLLVFVLSGALCATLGTSCDHGIDPPLPEWLDTSDGDHSIHPPDSQRDGEAYTDPQQSDTGEEDTTGSSEIETEEVNDTVEPTDTATAEDTGSTEPEDTSTPDANDSESAEGDSDEPLPDTGESSASDEDSGSVDSKTEEPCLVISEYIEGSAKNKGVELFNCGSESLSLQGFTLCTIFNQETECGKTLDLSEVELEGGILRPWEVLTVCYSGIDASFSALCDHAHALAYFNGDDRLVLKHADAVIDVFGEMALPPEGNPWKDATYRRCDLTPFDGVAPFDVTSLYSVYGIDDFSDFGLPPMATASCQAP